MTECELMCNLKREVSKYKVATITINTKIFSAKDIFESENVAVKNNNGIEICITSDNLEDDREYVISNFSDVTRVYDEAYDISTYTFYNDQNNETVKLSFL